MILIKSNQKKYTIIFILTILYIVSRLINLNSDIPLGWDVIFYQHFDEVFYSLGAVNLFHHGQYNPEVFGLRLENASGTIPYWDLIIYWFFKLFGANLFSIRLSSVIAGLIGYLLYVGIIFSAFAAENNKDKKIDLFTFIFILYPIFDPLFYYSNVIHESSAYRLMMVNLILYLTLFSIKISSRKAFILGLLTSFSFFFVYPQNAFLSLFVFILLFCNRNKKNGFLFVIGWSVIFLIWIYFYLKLFNTPIKNMLTMMANSGRIGGNFFSLSKIKNIVSPFFTNFIVFSPFFIAIFYLFFATFLLNVSKLIKNQSVWVLLIFFLSFFTQSLISIDYVARKGIILYAPILLFIYILLKDVIKFENYKSKSYLLKLSLILIPIIIIISLWLHIYTKEWGPSFLKIKFISKWEYFLSFLIVLTCIISAIYYRNSNILKFILLCSFFYNIFFIYKYKLSNVKTYSNTIAEIGNLKQGYLVGELSYAFSLGNKNLQPFNYLYYSRFHGFIPDSSGLTKLDRIVFDRFIEKSNRPIYTIVQDTTTIFKNFPHSSVVYHTSKYNDVESYYSLSTMVENNNKLSQKNVFVILIKK